MLDANPCIVRALAFSVASVKLELLIRDDPTGLRGLSRLVDEYSRQSANCLGEIAGEGLATLPSAECWAPRANCAENTESPAAQGGRGRR